MKFPVLNAVDVIVPDDVDVSLTFSCHTYTVIVRGLPSSASWQDLKVSEMAKIFAYDGSYV